MAANKRRIQAMVPEVEASKPLAGTLSPQELASLEDRILYADVILSYKAELRQVHIECGAWQLRAETAELAAAESCRLKRQLEGVQKANRQLLLRAYGPQPIEVAR